MYKSSKLQRGIKFFAFHTLLFLLLVSFVIATITLAQQPRPAQAPSPTPTYSTSDLGELKRLQQAALQSDYAYRQTAYLTNNIGPRLSGSAQAQAAVEYVASEMRKVGCEVQLERVIVQHWVRGDETGALVEYKGQAQGTTQKVVLTALGGSVATPAEGVTAEIVVVNNFDELRALGREGVTGKIVLFNKPFDTRLAANGFSSEAYRQAVIYRGAGASEAARFGAIASLIRSVGGANYRLPHTGSVRYAADAPQIPAGAVAAEDADMIAQLARDGRVRMRLTLTPQQKPETVSYNVIADLKGSERPSEIVIVSGHLDSWDLGTGAIDDASGVAMAMATVQLLSELKMKPKRTIRMIAWMNEENGLAGGRTYAQNRKAEIASHFAAIESDRGAGHALGFDVKGRPEILTMLTPVSNLLQNSGAGVMRLTEGTEADISPLAAEGVPAFGLLQDTRTYFDYHHTAADTLDKIVTAELSENVAVMSVLAYALANSPQPLPR